MQRYFSRERWPLLGAMSDIILDRWSDRVFFEKKYTAGPDPWQYLSDPREFSRHQLAIQLLNQIRSGKTFGRALEIGCGEGVFTELLAPLCDSLLAVDLSAVAIQRARRRQDGDPGVSFALWDLGRDAVPGAFDLVVVMDVLCYFVRPRTLSRAVANIARCVGPNGYLLAGNERGNLAYEGIRGTGWLVRGGEWLNARVAKHRSF